MDLRTSCYGSVLELAIVRMRPEDRWIEEGSVLPAHAEPYHRVGGFRQWIVYVHSIPSAYTLSPRITRKS